MAVNADVNGAATNPINNDNILSFLDIRKNIAVSIGSFGFVIGTLSQLIPFPEYF